MGILFSRAPKWWLRRRINKAQRLLLQSLTLLENDLSNLTLDRIEQELQLLNASMADANDIAMLAAFSTMPAELDNESMKGFGQLRNRMIGRARTRAEI